MHLDHVLDHIWGLGDRAMIPLYDMVWDAEAFVLAGKSMVSGVLDDSNVEDRRVAHMGAGMD